MMRCSSGDVLGRKSRGRSRSKEQGIACVRECITSAQKRDRTNHISAQCSAQQSRAEQEMRRCQRPRPPTNAVYERVRVRVRVRVIFLFFVPFSVCCDVKRTYEWKNEYVLWCAVMCCDVWCDVRTRAHTQTRVCKRPYEIRPAASNEPRIIMSFTALKTICTLLRSVAHVIWV